MSKHKPELDGIRGIAILGVLLTHSWGFIEPSTWMVPFATAMSFGQWGVDLFFALSGFLITGILIDTKEARNYLKSFYVRRALRIWPLYYAVITGLFLLALALPRVSPSMPIRAEWASYFFYLQNIPLFWPHGFVSGHMLGHFWSLAVEEQFYFVWPWVILFLPETAVLWICRVGFLLALPLRLYLHQYVYDGSWALMILTTSRMDGLLVGAVLAFLVRRDGRFPARYVAVPATGGLAILAAVAIFGDTGEFIGTGPHMRTFGVTAMALLSGALIGESQRRLPAVDRILTAPLLRFFGRYAYGIYVFHIPLFLTASRLLGPGVGLFKPLPVAYAIPFILLINAASILIAVVSFELYESKLLRLKRFFEPQFPERLMDPLRSHVSG